MVDRRELDRMVDALPQPPSIKLLAKENLRMSLAIAGAVSEFLSPKSAWVGVLAALELEEEGDVSVSALVLLSYLRKFIFNLYEEVVYIAVVEDYYHAEEETRARRVLGLVDAINSRAKEYKKEQKKLEEFRRIAKESTASYEAALAEVLTRTRTKYSWE